MARIRKSIIMAFIAIVIMSIAGPLPGAPAGRVLVLGFDSGLINDIQDRILRETLMREFYNRGCPIVPVMETESLFYGGRIRQIRKLDHDTVRAVCDDLKAGYACYGSIVPEDGGKDGRILQGKSYVCAITLYRRDKDTFYEMKFSTTGNDRLHLYFQSVADIVVPGILKQL